MPPLCIEIPKKRWAKKLLEMPLDSSKQLEIFFSFSMVLKRKGIMTTSFAFFNFLFYSPRYNVINVATLYVQTKKI